MPTAVEAHRLPGGTAAGKDLRGVRAGRGAVARIRESEQDAEEERQKPNGLSHHISPFKRTKWLLFRA